MAEWIRRGCGPALIGLALGCLALPAGAISIAVTPTAPLPVAPMIGDQITLDINVSGLGALMEPALSSYDLDLTWNPAALALVNGSVTQDEPLGTSSPFQALYSSTPMTGDLNLAGVSFLSVASLVAIQPAAFRLAQFTVKIKALENANLALVINQLGDSMGSAFPSGSVSVTQPPSLNLPEPGLGLLLLMAVSVFPWVGRR